MNRSNETVEMKGYDRYADAREEPRATRAAIWTAIFVALSALWSYGYSVGAANAVHIPIVKFIRKQYEERYKTNASLEVVEAVWVTSSAMFPTGGLLGTFLIGPLSRRFGRRMSILLGHILTVVLSTFMGLSGVLRFPEMIIIARLGLGVVSGAIGIGICPMYLTEISPLHVRGIFGAMVGTGISVGILAANVIGLPEALGTDELWPLVLAITGIPSLFFIALYKCIPESPRKLFLEDGDTEKSIKVLQKLNGIKNVNPILDEMQAEEKAARSIRQMSVIEVLRSSSLRRPLVIAVFIASAQQLSGANGVVFNSNRAFLNAGIPAPYVAYASIGLAFAPVIINLICMFMTETWGRKTPLIVGYSLQALCLLLLIIATELQYLSRAFSYLTVILSLGYMCGFAFGAGPVTHIIIPELFNQASRSAGMILSSTAIWVTMALCVFVTPYMLDSIRGFTFLPYFILTFFSAIFIAFKAPETKNKTFTEIFNLLRGQEQPKNRL